MVEEQGPHRREAAQVVLAGDVVAVPGHHIEGALADLGHVESALPLDEEPAGLLLPLVGGEGSQEVPGIGEAVGTDWSALRAGEARTVVLAHEPAGFPVTQLYLELHAARQKGDLARREIDQAQFRAEAQAAELRDHQQLAVRGAPGMALMLEVEVLCEP